MKKLMVKRCEATYNVDEGLYAITCGLPHPPSNRWNNVRLVVRCWWPLGHKEEGHEGAQEDIGPRWYHLHSWGGR